MRPCRFCSSFERIKSGSCVCLLTRPCRNCGAVDRNERNGKCNPCTRQYEARCWSVSRDKPKPKRGTCGECGSAERYSNGACRQCYSQKLCVKCDAVGRYADGRCVACAQQHVKKYRARPEAKQKRSNYNKQWDEENAEHKSQHAKEYRAKPEVRENTREYLRQRRSTEQGRLEHCLRSRLRSAFRNQGLRKPRLGTDYSEHFEKLGPRPSPNHVIDHIFPLAALDLTDPAQLAFANSPSNLRWITAKENGHKVALDLKVIKAVRRWRTGRVEGQV